MIILQEAFLMSSADVSFAITFGNNFGFLRSF